MNDSFAFRVFVAVFSGGLALVTIGMVWIAVTLVRRNRRKPWSTSFSTKHAILREEMAADQPHQDAGLCGHCVHARLVTSSRGSVFYFCGLSEVDPAFPKYPRLPVLRCNGFRDRRDEPGE